MKQSFTLSFLRSRMRNPFNCPPASGWGGECDFTCQAPESGLGLKTNEMFVARCLARATGAPVFSIFLHVSTGIVNVK